MDPQLHWLSRVSPMTRDERHKITISLNLVTTSATTLTANINLTNNYTHTHHTHTTPRCTTALVHDVRMGAQHACPWAPHPEAPERITAVLDELRAQSLAQQALRLPARLASRAEVELCHEVAHWDALEGAVALDAKRMRDWCEAHESLFLSGRGSLEAPRLACGGVLELTEAVLGGTVRNGLAIVRPPGPHAETHRAMGFCLFNSVAVAAARARQLGARRVLIVDWDIHQGQGVRYPPARVIPHQPTQTPHAPMPHNATLTPDYPSQT